MESTIETSAPAAAPTMAAPAPAMAPMSQPAPTMPMAPAPIYAEGGGISAGIKGFFSDINIVDIALSALVVAGLLYSISYYKLMISVEKSAYRDISDRVGKLESAALAAKKTQESINASGSSRRRGMLGMA